MERNDDIEEVLERFDCNPKWRGRYWLIRCPKHEDRSPSAQCFPDGWINCMAGCGRFHIDSIAGRKVNVQNSNGNYEHEKEEEIKRGDFTNLWADLDPLPNDLDVKGIDGKTLNKLGWRWYPGGNGYYKGIFIPYFNMDRTKVPFFQIRHLEGDRRFTFAKDVTPILWGFDVLPKVKDELCFTEGTRDAAILRSIGVPAVALPSASSGKIMKGLEKYCNDNKIRMVAICDKDEAGEGLLKTLQSPYTDLRSPIGKDVGDFLSERGVEALRAFYAPLQISQVLI